MKLLHIYHSRQYFCMILSPSLLSANFACLGEEVRAIEDAGVRWLHLDVMDGCFVPNITFGAGMIAALRKCCDLFFDVHLMIDQPGRHLASFIGAGADLIVVHAEADPHLSRTIAQIHAMGARAGVAINPATDISVVRWLASDIDLLLIMGVNPGFSGQAFIPQTISKVAMACSFLSEVGSTAVIQVDGGVNPENLPLLAQAGARVFVSGSSFFQHRPYADSFKKFRDAVAPSLKSDRTGVYLWKHQQEEG